MSKTISAALLLFLTVAAGSASAQTTFSVNVTFSDGDTLSGTFTSSSPYTSISTWNVQVTGPAAGHDFSSSTLSGFAILQGSPTSGCGADAEELTFASPAFAVYSTLCLSTALSSTGATLDLPNTLDCDGTCGTATAGSITPANVPPTITKVFGVGTITAGQTTSLTFTIGNPSGNTALTNVSFTDTLPAGLEVAGSPAPTNTCGGTVTAIAGTNSITLSGGSLAAGPSSCTIVVSIEAETAGTWVNTTSTVTSNESCPPLVRGLPSPCGLPATATILVLPADAIQVSYAANLTKGDSLVNLTNAGTAGGNICANVYVFAEDEQLIACCTCPLTPNALATLSANKDLVSNTLTPGVPNGITTMLVASSGTCDAVNPGPLVKGLRAWSTTLHAAPSGQFSVTENHFLNVAWSAAEFAKMTQMCAFIEANGSGYGICASCKAGAAGANRK